MRRLLSATVAVAMLLAAPALAKVATPVTGPFTVSGATVTKAQQVSEHLCLVNLTATFKFEGTLDGDFTAPFNIVHRGPCDQPAAETFVARGTFAGTVDGSPGGTFDFVFVGTIDASRHARGTLRVLRGTAGLARLRGALELTGISGVGGTYHGTLTT